MMHKWLCLLGGEGTTTVLVSVLQVRALMTTGAATQLQLWALLSITSRLEISQLSNLPALCCICKWHIPHDVQLLPAAALQQIHLPVA